jgi:hypothetical protein
MLSTRYLSFILLFAVLLVSNTVAVGQDADTPNIIHIQTIQATFPDDGSVAERDSLWKIFFDATVMKNDLIVSQRTLQHFWGDNSNEIVLIREYENWADVNSVNNGNGALVRAMMPDSLERVAFFQRYNEYFGPHGDELFNEIQGLQK